LLEVKLSMSLILVKLMVESFIEHINIKIIYFLLILSRYGEKIDAQISKNQIPLPMSISFFKTLHAFLYS
jgi:hypothetical protein